MFAVKFKMLDITGVLRVIWMLMGFSAIFHSVAFPEVVKFTVSELSKCRIIITLDGRNLQKGVLKNAFHEQQV